MKRIFIIYLLFASCLLANAQFSGKGSGTAENPYQISTPIHVDEIRNLTGIKDVCLVLTGDIDMTDYITENYGNAGWYPIPDFQGNLNGCGYTISGLRINRPTLGMIGFFGSANNAKISNLTLEYSDDIVSGQIATGSGSTTTGAFVAKATNSEIVKCGVIAKSIQNNASDKDIYHTFGGFVGQIELGTIKECCCTFTEATTMIQRYRRGNIGGLVGRAEKATIENNRVLGNVSGAYYCGGVIGCASSCVLNNNLFEGNVTGYTPYQYSKYDGSVGGLVGYMYDTDNWGYNKEKAKANVIIADSIWNKEIGSCYRIGNFEKGCEADLADPLTNRGYVNTKHITNNGNTLYDNPFDDNIYNGLSTGHSMLKQKSLYANMGWDMENVWSIDNGNSYPRLKWEVEKGLVKPTLTISNGQDEINEGDVIQFFAEKKTANLPGGISYTYYQCDNDEPTIKNTSKQQQDVTVTVNSTDYKHLNWSGINGNVADMSDVTESRKTILESDGSLALKLHATFADGDFTTYTANITVSCKDYSKSFTIEFVNENPNKPICPTPTITYSDGELSFECDCEGDPLYHVSTTSPDVKDIELTGKKLSLERTYNIEVYATASSYAPSDIARLTICWLDMELEDVNGIVEVKSIPVQVSLANGSLHIKNVPMNAKIELYDLSGILINSVVATTSEIAVDIPYVNNYLIVKINDKSYKCKM